MDRQITYFVGDTSTDYAIHFDDENPAQVRITGPSDGEGVSIPFEILAFLLDAYRVRVHHDIFEHKPVPGYEP